MATASEATARRPQKANLTRESGMSFLRFRPGSELVLDDRSAARVVQVVAMKHTTEFLTSEEEFKTTKQIFHPDLSRAANSWTPVAAAGPGVGAFAGVYGTGVNPITFDDASQLFYGRNGCVASETPESRYPMAWFKAYRSEHVDEYQDPNVRNPPSAPVF
jgi:hypothetical protein